MESNDKEIGLLCGVLERYAFTVVIRPRDRLISYGGSKYQAYTEADDELHFSLKNDSNKESICRLNRYTLEIQCRGREDSAEVLSMKCKLGGIARIPISRTYWLSCGIQGKPRIGHF